MDIHSESKRTEALHALQVLDTPSDLYLDSLTSKVAKVCGMPICLISLVDTHRQWFKSCVGLDAQETPRDISFCQYAIKQDSLFEVPDATLNEQFVNNPLVTDHPHIRYYAGQPLLVQGGHRIGTLCVIDTQPNELTTEQKVYLKAVANCIEAYLQQNQVIQQNTIASQFQRILMTSHDDLIFAKDEQCRIVFANSSFLKLYPGRTLEDLLGKTTVEDYIAEEAEAFLANDRIALAEGQSEILEEIVFPDAVKRILWTKKKRFFGADGNAYILGIARDVTKAETANRRLQQSYKELDNFAYIASHDLKAPINGIEKVCGWIEEDLSEYITGETKAHFELVKGRIYRMRKLLDDLLLYSRAGRNSYPIETVSLQHKVNEVCDLLAIPDNVAVSTDNIELQVYAVPLEMVLRNLLQNAIKHAEKSTVNINISVNVESRYYIIQVDDDGPGIPEPLREKAKMIFQTLKPRDQVEGSGLGLAMVEKELDALGGKLNISDSSLGGTRIQLNWPKPVSKGVTHGN